MAFQFMIMLKNFLTILTLAVWQFGFSQTQQETLLLRNPSISAHHITFVYGGDIWLADKDGKHPKRLTVNPAVEQNPVFSPDGERIAFSGNYDGNTDVYVISIHGGEPVRVTNHPTADVLRGWLSNQEVYFTSQREFTYSLGSRLFSSTIDGRMDKPLMMPEANQGSPSKDGRFWAYIKNTDPTERDRVAFKRYRGGGMPSIWVFDTQSNEIEIIPGKSCNDVKPLWLGDKIYFLSDRDKIVNVFSYDVKTKQIERLTNHTDYDIRTLQGHGDELIYEQAGRLHIYNLAGKQSKPVSISIQADAPYKRSHYVDFDESIRGRSLSPTGKRALFESRGEIFSIPKENGDARNISQSPGSHERYPSWSPDGQWISYLSDKNGRYELVLRDQKAQKEPTYISLGDQYFYFAPQWSPDSKKVFFNDAHLNLYYLDVASKKVHLIDQDLLGSHTGRAYNNFQSSWSTDSKWIAYVKTLENGVSAIFMYDVLKASSHQITDGMSEASAPVFTKDRKYLLFNASTNVGLTNSGLHMTAYDRSAQYNSYAFVLSSDSTSIIDYKSDEEPVKVGSASKDKNTKADTTKSDKSIQVDFENINNRIIGLPIPSGSYAFSGLVENKLLYMRHGKIFAYDLKTMKEEVLVDNARSYEVSSDGKQMLYSNAQGHFIVKAGQKPAGDSGKLSLGQIKLRVEPTQEWEQIFNEVWQMQKEFFYVENMHGADWEAAKEKYKKFLPFVNHRSDLNYILNEMLGELVVGHSYIYPGDEPSAPSVSTGVLGADYELHNNRYRIQKIYTRLDWNPDFKAPLAEPGTKIKEGMYILMVNGKELTGATDIYSLFDFTVDKQVTLTLSETTSLDDSFVAVVKPISFAQEISLRRENWVEQNRKKVDALSKGQIAYVYMPNTGREGYNSFNRYYFSQMDKKALLLDERNNGGGSVADYVIDLLSRELIAGWGIRDGKSFTTPGNGIFGPKAMIINENAGSGGDMMPYMFRFKGLGKLVGRTTMGILVGISGYPTLIDGGRVTSPNFGVFDLNGNYIIENEGVAPDIFVEQTPKELLQGKDPQLERTVELLLQEMKSYPYKQIKKPADPVRVN